MSRLDTTTYGVVSVGDVVRIGRGRRAWRVVGFWTSPADGTVLTDLEPHDAPGFTNGSAAVDRLTVIEHADGIPYSSEEPCS
jgi:hypothetical protein